VRHDDLAFRFAFRSRCLDLRQVSRRKSISTCGLAQLTMLVSKSSWLHVVAAFAVKAKIPCSSTSLPTQAGERLDCLGDGNAQPNRPKQDGNESGDLNRKLVRDTAPLRKSGAANCRIDEDRGEPASASNPMRDGHIDEHEPECGSVA